VVIKSCTNFGGAIVSVLRADKNLLEWCQALNQRSIALINISLALCGGVFAGPMLASARYRYANAIATPASAVHR